MLVKWREGVKRMGLSSGNRFQLKLHKVDVVLKYWEILRKNQVIIGKNPFFG